MTATAFTPTTVVATDRGAPIPRRRMWAIGAVGAVASSLAVIALVPMRSGPAFPWTSPRTARSRPSIPLPGHGRSTSDRRWSACCSPRRSAAGFDDPDSRSSTPRSS